MAEKQVRKDLIYEGITTVSPLMIFSVIVVVRKDLIYEGITTLTAIFPAITH